MICDISFIIPVYNAANYIDRCVKSVLKQTNITKEIILINDGSKDDSLKVCQDLASRYECIKVVDKENEGVSVARNVGINLSNGRYICFLDADDYYCLNFSAEFVHLCDMYSLDIIRGFYKIYDEETESINDNNRNIDYCNKVLTGKEFLINSINSNCNEVVPWLGFFSRDFIISNHLSFPKGIAYEEDQLFFLQALLSEGVRVMQTDSYFYMYVKRKGSCTATPKVSNIEDACYITSKELELITSLDLSIDVENAANIYAMWSFFQVSTLFGRLSKTDRQHVYKNIPIKLMDHAIRYSTTSKNKMKFYLLKHSSSFYYLIFTILKGRGYK